MTQRAPSEQSSLAWLKIFIGLGVLVVGYWFFFPLILSQAEEREYYRFQGCQKNQRVDCDSSLVWQMEGWSLTPEAPAEGTPSAVGVVPEPSEPMATSTAPEPVAHDPSQRRSAKTSEAAPKILTVQLVDVPQQSGWFRPDANGKVTVQATVEGAKSVDLYYNAKDANGLPIVKKLGGLSSKTGGEYTGSFTVPPNMLGELEIRAMDGAKESASLFLPVAVQ
jgi:hypothetical protein